MATGLLFIYSQTINERESNAKDILMPIFSIACYAFTGYSLYSFIKNAPKITLNKDYITFNKQTYSISDIKKVTLTGKRPFKYAIHFPMEAATLTFNDNERKYIFDDIYSNSWEIKSFLKQVVVDKKDFIELSNSTIDKNSLESDYYQTFKGNQFTSLRGISLWTVVGLFAYMIANNKGPNTVGLTLFFLGFSAFWFTFNSYLMHYFQVSDNFFVVRNHNFIWMKKAYNLSDIKEIVFETQGKTPNCLRVITKDFRNRLFPAGTLRDKNWFALKDQLESHKIKVRNECI
jgi:ABC-type multidrug transport system fused ATPase/permease subunit